MGPSFRGLRAKPAKMVRYCHKPNNATKSAIAKGNNLRVSFKNTCETANTIKRMPLARAVTFLKNVMRKKECVPFTRFNGGCGRTAQANATYKGLEAEQLMIEHIMVQRARQMRRRTYR